MADFKSKINCATLQIASQDTVAKNFMETKAQPLDIIPQLAEIGKPQNVVSSDPGYKPNLYQSVPLLQLKDLNHMLNEFKQGHISFFGPAGSGKTTLLKTIARNTIKKKFEGLAEVELVVFLKCCNLNTSSKFIPSHHLLSNIPHLTEDEQKGFSKFVEKHPNKVLFILDGLDTFAGDLISVKQAIRKPGKSATSAQVLYSLLCGELYPNCRVITSTRDCTAEIYKNFQRYKRVMLAGLTVNDIYAVVRTYFDEREANNIMQELQRTPSLMKLCETPVFLVFTLIGRKLDSNFCPTTMSQILVFLFENFIRSEHATEKEIHDVIFRLQPLSFLLTCEGRINFSTEDLQKVGLDPKMVKDVAITIPGGHDNKMICFIHQSIQEMLSTFHIAGMKFRDFCNFVSEKINLPKYRVIRRMLCGMLCNPELCEKPCSFIKGENMSEKQSFLQNALKEEVLSLTINEPSQKVLELIISLYEAGAGARPIIHGSLKNVVLNGSAHPLCLSPSDLHIIGTVVAQCTKLDHFVIIGGNVMRRELALLYQCMSGSDVEISIINMSLNPLTPSGFYQLGQIMKHCKAERIDVCGHDLASNHLESLKSSLTYFQLKCLNLCYNPFMSTIEMMSPESRSESFPIHFKPDVEHLPDEIKQIAEAQQVTMTLSTPGLWTDAPYDLVYAITCLFPNVTEDILLYGWKISNDYRELLQSKLDENATKLKVHLAMNVILSAKSMKPQPQTVELNHYHALKLGLATRAPSVVAYGACHPVGRPMSSSPDEMESAEDCAAVLDVPKINDHVHKVTGPPEKMLKVVHDTSGPVFWETLERVKTIEELEEFLFSRDTKFPPQLIHKLQVVRHRLTDNDLKLLPLLLDKFSSLKELELRSCGLDENLLQRMCNHMESSNCKNISTFSITATQQIHSLLPSICAMMKLFNTKELNIEETRGSKDFLKILEENLDKVGVNCFHKLDLSYTKNMSDFATLGRMLCNWITDLKVVNCDLKHEHLRAMYKSLTGHKSMLECLDVSYNADLTEDDIALFPNILRKDEVKLISMRGCDLSEDDLAGFDKFSNQVQVKEIDLSHNTELFDENLGTVGRLVKKLNTKRLSLAGCELDGHCIDSLLRSSAGYKLPYLDVKGNVKIAPEMTKFSKLLRTIETKYLDLSECKLTPHQISNFAKSLGTYKLKRINVSDSERNIDKKYVEAICELGSSVKEELIAIFPRISKEHEDQLQSIVKKFYNKDGPQITLHCNRRWKSIEHFRIMGSIV